MKVTLTGAAGNITKPLAKKLLNNGHNVTVIGRHEENLRPLQDEGAKIAIGNIEDEEFLIDAFKSADVVYTMIPAPYHLDNWIAYGEKIAENYRKAVVANNVKKVVNLSTYGAHKLEGIGAINSIGQLEKSLDKLKNTTVIHLRAGYFYNNLYRQIDTLKATGILGSNYGDPDGKIILVHTHDIADTAFEAITSNKLDNQTPYYVVSDVRSWSEIATAIGKALGKKLSWTSFPDEAFKLALQQNNFPAHLIKVLLEIGHGLASGSYVEHYFSLNQKPPLGKTKLEDFAKEFAQQYNKTN